MVFIRLAPSSGRSTGSAMSAGMAALDVFVNPAAARAREELDRQHEQVIPTPSPGDRMLEEGRVTIPAPVAPRTPPAE